MKQEDKELLLRDLCSRLPYGVKIELTNSCSYHHENVAKKGDGTIDRLKGFTGSYFSIYHDNPLDWDWYENDIDVEDIKPYLFPMSSMTEEQKQEYCQLQQRVIYNSKGLANVDIMKYVNWCYENHLDINGLIPLGLAIDATGLGIYGK